MMLMLTRFMKTKQFVCVLFACLLSVAGRAQVEYVTLQPLVDEVHDADVRIRRVELTATNTVLYMTFKHRTATKPPKKPARPVPFPYEFSPNEVTSTIQFDPTARLYADRGDKSYKFIRAENIPTRQRIDVSQGQQVDFVAYFERLDPGVTVFDLFECNDREGNTCFNFYGVHVTNPRKIKKVVKPVPAKPLPEKPVPAKPAPKVPAKPAPATPVRPNATSVAAPVTTLAVRGTVRDSKTSKPIGATVACQRISGKTVGAPETIRADAQTGSYRAVVNPAAVYALTVSAKGYFSKTDTLTTNRADLQRDLLLTPIETGAKLTLQNIEFDAGQFALRPQSYPELNQLVQLLRTNPTLKIRLEGHTDVVGEFDANLGLSRNRVNEVKSYLVKKGIDAGRIDTIGYGASRPLVNKTAEQNRRVELVITQS